LGGPAPEAILMVGREFERKLAAILAADVVGYSRLMGEDEAGTHARLRAVRKDLIEPKIAEYRGRMVKLTGDGALVEFASVVDAVQCAVVTQLGVAARNADLPPEQRLEFRLGVNLGDVIIDGDDIYGDGVNVAARLEGLAPPGGVCISDIVHQMIRDRLDFAFEDLGEQQIKNIAQRVRIWRWLDDRRATEPPLSTAEEAEAPPSPDRPSIAVLPFDNLSRDPDQEYFSDGLTEDLITDLSQLSALSVASRHAVFQYKGAPAPPQHVGKDLGVRYVLEGSVRRAANRIRINAQLIDVTTGYHVWAERYDRVLEDIFDLQDEITEAIVAALKVHLTPRERDSIAQRYTENLEAYDLFLQARESHLLWRSREAAARARVALEQAIQLDPGFAAAYALLAENCRQEWKFEWRQDVGILDQALQLARRAVELDDQLSLAHMLLGWIHLWRMEHDRAIAEVTRSVELDPTSAEAWIRFGHILDFAGQPEKGLGLVEKAMRLEPHHPFIYSFWHGHAFQSLQRFEEALAAFRRAKNRNPDFVAVYQHEAAVLAQLRHLDEARAAAAHVLRLNPQFSVKREAEKSPYKDPAVLERLIDGQRKAGLPE
jgi:adenylate cyclase